MTSSVSPGQHGCPILAESDTDYYESCYILIVLFQIKPYEYESPACHTDLATISDFFKQQQQHVDVDGISNAQQASSEYVQVQQLTDIHQNGAASQQQPQAQQQLQLHHQQANGQRQFQQQGVSQPQQQHMQQQWHSPPNSIKPAAAAAATLPVAGATAVGTVSSAAFSSSSNGAQDHAVSSSEISVAVGTNHQPQQHAAALVPAGALQ